MLTRRPRLPATLDAASDAISIGHLEQLPFALDIGPAVVAVVAWWPCSWPSPTSPSYGATPDPT